MYLGVQEGSKKSQLVSIGLNNVDHSIELDVVGSTLEVPKFHPSFKA